MSGATFIYSKISLILSTSPYILTSQCNDEVIDLVNLLVKDNFRFILFERQEGALIEVLLLQVSIY